MLVVRKDFFMHILFCKWHAYGQENVIFALKKLGHQVDELFLEFEKSDLEEYHESINDAFFRHMDKNNYDVVFSLNYFPIISSVCKHFHTAYISWCVDAPLIQLYHNSVYNSCNIIFSFDRVTVQRLREMGVSRIYHLPLSADVEHFDTINYNTSQYSADVSFVGSTYEERTFFTQISSHISPYLSGYFQAITDIAENLPGINFLEEAISLDIKNELMAMLHLSYDDSYVGKWEMLFANSFLGTYVTYNERLHILQKLSEHFSVFLYTKSPTELMPLVKKCGSIDYLSEMPIVFRNSAINLNITLKTIKTGIPLRVFDVLGCGGFLISNYQEELEELFVDGKDLVLYHSQEELVEKVDWYLKHDTERKKIAVSGYNTVRERHTALDRLEELFRIYQG